LSYGNLVGVATPSPPFCGLRRLKNPRKNIFGFFKKHFRFAPCFSPIGERANHKKKGAESHEKIQHAPPPPGNQDTLDRERIRRVFRGVTLCKMSQAEFIRQALIKSSIRPVITVSPVNDELLSAVGKLTAEYGKIGGNLNQIARCLNEYGAPYNALSQEVRAATAELAALKFEVLQKVGEAVGNIQTYQL